jgi:hypothetical protein
MTSWWRTLLVELDARWRSVSDGERLALAIDHALRTRAPAKALDDTRRLLVERVVRRAKASFEPNPLALFIVDLRDGLVMTTREAAQQLASSPAPGAAQASRRLTVLASELSGDTFVQHLINLCLEVTGVYTESTPVQHIDAAALIEPLVGLLGRVPSWTREWSDPRVSTVADPDRPLRPAAV